MTQHTPLFDAHVAAGGKMVPFAGWAMPVNYGSQVAEHHAVRQDAGMFDVSHMTAVDISGTGATGWLQSLLANDVAKLTKPGKALYSGMLNPDGGVIDDLIVYCFGERYRMVINAGTTEKDLLWMNAQLGDAAVTLAPRRDLAMLAVQGPNARQKVAEAMPQWADAINSLGVFQGVEVGAEVGNVLVARTGYTGEDGVEIAVPAAQATSLWDTLRSAGVVPAGLGARDTLRLEAGMNLYGQDMDETVSPLAAGMGWTIAWNPDRPFIGQAALLAEKQARAAGNTAHPEQRGLVLRGRAVLRGHMAVRCASGEGIITSGTFSPTLQTSIALARLPQGIPDGATVEVDVRGQWLSATVVTPPFVRHGKILISTPAA